MNKVFINEYNQIEIIVDGDQTVESVDAMGKDVEKLVNKLRNANKPTAVMDNLLLMGKVPQDARRKVVEYAKNIEYDRLAFLGNSPVARLGSNLMLTAIGKGNKVKYFDEYSQAVAWLSQTPDSSE